VSKWLGVVMVMPYDLHTWDPVEGKRSSFDLTFNYLNGIVFSDLVVEMSSTVELIKS
jgi:hypothetical protein